jgi:mannose-6-phosphate isomerase-like protein (cupin superfamily)
MLATGTASKPERMLRSVFSHLQRPAAVATAHAGGEQSVPLAANGAPRMGNADRSTMGRSGGAHGGPLDPELEFCSIFQGTTETAPFSSGSPFAFVHAAVIPPGGGIGLHTHHDCEEIFVTIDNASQFTHNERTTQVESGAAVPCRARECHGIYNHTQSETRWFNFNVALAREPTHGQTADATDLGEMGSSRATRVGVPLVSPDQLPIGVFSFPASLSCGEGTEPALPDNERSCGSF